MSRGRAHATSLALAATLWLAGALVPARADPPGQDPAPAPSPPVLVLDDPSTIRERRYVHDVTRVFVEAAGGRMVVRTRFRKPLLDGMFTCVHLYVDCDGRPETGIDGADLWVRAAVGSRFQRTSAPPAAEGLPRPRTLLRGSWSAPQRPEGPGGGRLTWMHRGTDPVETPRVEGTDLVMAFPLSLLSDHGLRYNRTIGVRIEAEGTCSEQPLRLDYVCADEGAEIVVDGKDDDWSGGPRVVDETGELHPDASEVDLKDVQVDHDRDHLYARVRFAKEGFGATRGDDVEDEDVVTLAVEPLETGGRYMRYQEYVFGSGHMLSEGSAALGRGVVEFGVPRRPEQTAFRVFVWSDAIRRDRVPDHGWADCPLPAGAFPK